MSKLKNYIKSLSKKNQKNLVYMDTVLICIQIALLAYDYIMFGFEFTIYGLVSDILIPLMVIIALVYMIIITRQIWQEEQE